MSASPPDRIAAYFGADVEVDPLVSSYNVAPTDDVYAVVAAAGDDGVHRALRAFEWGLVPVWAKDRKAGAKMINIRAETLAGKAALKGDFRKHRCIVPMDGFYEWQAAPPSGPVGKSGKPVKQPYFVERVDGEPLAVAGLWSAWRDRAAGRGADWLHTTTVVTTAANATMAAIHDRMPVILPRAMWDLWLDPANQNIDVLARLLVPAPEHLLTLRKVSTDVNNVRNDGPSLVEPI